MKYEDLSEETKKMVDILARKNGRSVEDVMRQLNAVYCNSGRPIGSGIIS